MMEKDKSAKILVTGGTGTTGRLVVEGLRERGIIPEIGTRTPSRESEVLFDWQQPETARRAFDGVDAVYIVAPTNTSDHGAVVPPVLDIARSCGVRRFVLLSASSLEAGGPMMGQIHAYLTDNVPEWTVLRPTWFLQNFSHQQHQITIRQENAIYSATGSGRVGFIDATDIARAAVSTLLEDKSWNRYFILTGHETLSYADVASKLSSILGRNIRHVNLDVDQLAERYHAGGLDKDYAQTLASMDKWIEDGNEDRVTDCVFVLTRQAPKSADVFIRENHQRWLS
ncbi:MULTISPECIES: NAD(P)H-binding protein [Agrobacterium]|uniref:NAD(P)H-binding protein n=1 Tax=Agrobacterium TaxID=357 RepID=UPI001E30349C|nr:MULTISPECIES: NAD(P)H-binding protein [Agrobacterium]MDX8310342.1 NAD(P)H-binding protein [Agrobacterium sp. rho-13.3]